MISTDDRIATTPNHEKTSNDLLIYVELLNTPQLARLSIYILQNGPVAIETIKTDLDMAHSITYKYIGQSEEMGVLSRHDDETPAMVTVESIRVLILLNSPM